MQKTKFISTIIFTFLTGSIIGSLATYFVATGGYRHLNFPQRHAARIEKTVIELNLNEQQRKQFYAIHLRYLNKGCAELQKTKPLMLQLMEEEANEINSILNPEQQKKYKEIITERTEKFKSKFANAELLKKHLPRQ
jgi:hypothetical protein